MTEEEIKNLVTETVKREVENSRVYHLCRMPLAGFAPVDEEDFRKIRETACEDHLSPSDILPDPKGLISFFIPFSKDVVRANARSSYVAREWAVA